MSNEGHQASPAAIAEQASKSANAEQDSKSAGKESAGSERLQKILARAGFGSRRKCEELILQGRVSVNGEICAQLGARADLERDKVQVDGERVRPPKPSYFVVNKPRGWYSTGDAPDRKILDLIPGDHPRLFTVGRLDKSCEGLMLATNDGETANILTHPRFMVPKVYKITVKGHIKFEDIAQIERALFYAISGGKFERIKVLKRSPKSSTLRLIVYEGLPPVFRDICTRFGHSVSRISRIRVGPLELGEMAPGQSHRLTPEESEGLNKYIQDVLSGKEQPPVHRLVTAEWIKKAAERTPDFEKKETGHRGKPDVGQRKRRIQMGQQNSSPRSGSSD